MAKLQYIGTNELTLPRKIFRCVSFTHFCFLFRLQFLYYVLLLKSCSTTYFHSISESFQSIFIWFVNLNERYILPLSILRYSGVHISLYDVFSKILKKPAIVQKYMKAKLIFIGKKQIQIFFEKPKTQKITRLICTLRSDLKGTL